MRQKVSLTPAAPRFEELVVDLLLAMGYGGTREEVAQVTQKSGDEGIDEIINEDRLGLDSIYIQAIAFPRSVCPVLRWTR